MTHSLQKMLAACVLALLCVLPANARDAGMNAEALKAYSAMTYRDEAVHSLPYRLLTPKGADAKDAGKYPLILFLHGAGERGADNASQLKWGGALLAGEVQAKTACFVVAPQCPAGRQWVNAPWAKGSYSTERVAMSDELRMAIDIVKQAEATLPVDKDRVYVMGLSMGGFATWDAIVREPDLFAAAVPICGSGDPSQAPRIKHLPVWAFHGGADTTVPTQGSRDMVEALKKAEAAGVKYTEFPGIGHASWGKAWDEPGLLDWLFAQKRGGASDSKASPKDVGK